LTSDRGSKTGINPAENVAFIFSGSHYNIVSLLSFASPTMSVQHPNLTLDERAFEGLLSAAFTIQEHNDRQKRAHGTDASIAINVCPHCGAQKPSNASPCGVCGLDEFRPGERLQRNWASMWLHSQDHSSERMPDGGPVQPNRISADVADDITAEIAAKDIRRALQPLLQSVADGPFLNKLKTTTSDGSIPDANVIETRLSYSLRALSNSPATESSDLTNTRSHSDLASNSAINPAVKFNPDFDPDFNSGSDPISQSAARPDSVFQRLSEWRVKLRFQRADFFLGLAVFVSAAALLWPAAVPRRPAALDPWERALVMLGIAEPPEPLIHLQGDPGVNVWIDPHSALYYCPGEDQYGKTTDGRLSSQREAEMDRFEPASRAPCE
jgi:ribosomal protein L40E